MRPESRLVEVALNAAETLGHLDPGPLAELRRIGEDHKPSVFWMLAIKHPHTIGHPKRERTWMSIIRIIAILTPKGDPSGRPRLHDRKRRLGAVLCDGGDPDWPPQNADNPKPVFSEQRLAQLLAARGSQREVLLTRAARAIARSRVPDSGVNAIDVALALLKPKDERLLAEPYYRRLDSANRSAIKSEGGIAQ